MKLTAIAGHANDGLYRAESGTIYFRKYRDGKGEIFKSTKTKDLSMARRMRDALMAELWNEKPKVVKRETVREIWAVWFQGMKETKSENTANSISASWNNLEPYIGDLFLSDVTLEWWTNVYIPQKRAEQNKRPTIDNTKRKFFNEWKWLSGFLKWSEASGKGGPDWKRPRIKNPDPEIEEGRAYSDDEIASLRLNASLRMTAFLEAGLNHFMRRSEIRLLEWNRINLVARTVHLRAQDTKIRKARTFPFNKTLLGLFAELKREADLAGVKSRFVFPSMKGDQGMTVDEFRRMWESCTKAAGLPKGSRFHWLRHTGLTKACKRKEINIAGLCVFAGLSIDELQKTYLHLTVDDLRGVENLVGAE